MDDVEKTAERADRQMELFQKTRATPTSRIAPYHRFCLFCADETQNGSAYCSDDCRLDAERLKQAQMRNGALKK